MIYRTVTTLLHAVFRLLFTLEYYGEDRVPDSGPVIIAGNHPSYLDPVLIILALDRRVFFMAWDKLFSVPLLGGLIRAMGAFPVRLGTRDPNAYEAARDILKAGKALGIFPEAGRTVEGPMNPLKTGTARLAIETGAPIVPVTITGAFDAWPSSRRLPWPRKITVKYHTPIVLDPVESAARRDDKAYHEEITSTLRHAIERRLLPSLAADDRKRRAFAGPASPVRVFELYPAIATLIGVFVLGGAWIPLTVLGLVHVLYLMVDIWMIKQGRLTKALRELATPAFAVLYGPWLAAAVKLTVPEWWTLAALAAGSALSFNWTNRYKAERFMRGALMAYFLSFVVALKAPHPFAPHLAFAMFTAIYAASWRPLFWYVSVVVMATSAGVMVWLGGASARPATVAYLALAIAIGVYIRFVKFSAHDGRMI